jgi:ESS family glutamate:Na+ symporter
MLIVLAVVLVSLKLGAFLSSYFAAIEIGAQKLVIPGYIGAMIVAALIRNAHDLLKLDWIKTDHVDLLGSITLAWLLAVVMVGLQLSQLASAAAPMVALVVMQTVIACALAYWVVFRVMGRDYEAAAMSAGMIGFGMGATSNAVATMKALARRFGPAPRAFLIVTVVGAFLIDFTNAMIITVFLQFFRG